MTVAGPLSGITIVDLTRVLAGPYGTLLLSDLGARVIKVEHPVGGDLARSPPPRARCAIIPPSGRWRRRPCCWRR